MTELEYIKMKTQVTIADQFSQKKKELKCENKVKEM